MAQIGTFTRNNDGFFGRIRTLTLDVEVTILPLDGDPAENAPNHRMFADGLEVGAAWDRTGERAGAYLSVSFDDPSFIEPIRARMFESDTKKDTWNLHWTRKSKRDEQQA